MCHPDDKGGRILINNEQILRRSSSELKISGANDI